MKRKNGWLFLSCLIVVALVLVSCQPTAVEEEEVLPGEEEVAVPEEEEEVVVTPPSGEPKYGGWMNIAFPSDVADWDPISTGPSGINQHALSFVYEKYGMGDWSKGPAGTNEWAFSEFMDIPDKYMTGCLAESWEMPDPLTYVFHLRKGVHFHNRPPANGREVTTEDIIYCTKRAEQYGTFSSDFNRLIVSYEALDKYTIQYNFSEPHSEMLFWLASLSGVYAPEAVEEYGNIKDYKHACGTGPFTIEDLVSGSSMTFQRNPNYWGFDEINPENRLPYVDGVKVLVIPQFPTQLAALRTGKIDWLMEVTPEDAASLRQTNPELKWKRALDSAARPKIGFKANAEPFDNLGVRQAMHMAIDFDKIVTEYLKGEGVILSYPISATSGEKVYTPVEKLPPSTRELFEYNPEKARQLLADAGYPNGFKTECIIRNLFVERMSIIVSYWADIGIDCELRVLETGAFLGELFGRRFKAVYAKPSGMGRPFQNLQYYYSTAFWNVQQVNDSYFDEMLDEISKCADETMRNKMIKDLNVYFIDQGWVLSFPMQYIYNFWQPWLNSYHGEYSLGLYNPAAICARVWIDRDLRKAVTGR